MKVGYVRCSTEEQNISKNFTDKANGKNTDRPDFKEMMRFVREGDVIVAESFSRIARNTRDLLSTLLLSLRIRESSSSA